MTYQNAGIGTKRRFETDSSECPICWTAYSSATEVVDTDKAELPGIVYEHDGYWCAEWADGEKVEGGFERNKPTNE